MMNRMPYKDARKLRPVGACYCDLPDDECYAKEHWNAVLPPKKVADAIQYASGYTLDLYCDHRNANHAFSEFPHQYNAETFGQCARLARKRGWVVHTATRTATCPKCSGKGR